MKGYRLFGVVLFLLVAAMACGAVAASAALPKGSVAVLVRGPSDQHVSAATSIITKKLIQNGYKVVDPKKLDAIRRSKAAALALDGNVDAIMKLSRQYGFSTLVGAQVEAPDAVLNEFKLFTSVASIAVMVTDSGGRQVYADTAMGKQVGYTPAEAAQKALEAAANAAADGMLQ